MTMTFQEIVQVVVNQMRVQGPTLNLMKSILDHYDGDFLIPVPEVPQEKKMPALTPALVGEVVDTLAQRAASQQPGIYCPAIDPSKRQGRRSREYADIRRRIIAATYDKSRWALGRRRYYRHLAAYSTSGLVVLPDLGCGLPKLEVRDPLGSFCEPAAAEELRQPKWAFFVNRYSGLHLRNNFPASRSENGGPISPVTGDWLWYVVEWYDEDQQVIGIVAPVDQFGPHINVQSPPYLLLSQAENRLGRVPVVMPHNVSLGKIAQRLGTLLGNVDLQAKLMSLDILAQERAIFPDMYAIARPGGQPTVLGGRWKDGREGDINLVTDVESIGVMRSTPDMRTSQIVDRLERNLRISSGLVPQAGGENWGSLRTGRAMDSLMGVALDPRIQELHEVTQSYMPEVNRLIFDTYKTFWPSKKFSMYSGWPGDTGLVEFTPSEHIEINDNTVSYSIAGADVVQTTQILGGLYGANALARRTFMQRHPYIDDPDSEASMIDEEAFEQATRDAVLGQIQSGQLPLVIASVIWNELRKGKSIFDALEAADAKARETQATQAPPPDPGMVGPPGTMPGLAAGPQAMMQAAPAAPPEQLQPGQVSQMRRLMQAMGA